MNEYLKVYEENKHLDTMFLIYGEDNDLFDKNILEFLVELGEFANETKCFKYWSKKEMNRSAALEELADCITMCFYFFNKLNIDLKEVKFVDNDKTIIDQFIYLYEQISLIKKDFTKERLIDIFVNLRYLGICFNFSDNDITNSCLNKIKKNIDRINSKTY